MGGPREMSEIEKGQSKMTDEELEKALKWLDNFVYEELCKVLEVE